MKTRDLALVALGASSQSARTKYVTQTVVEKRAPTDESIRLAKEYEEKAWAAVSSRVLLDVESIDAKVVYCEKSFEDRSKRLLFKVNGRKVDVRLDDGHNGEKLAVLQEVAEAITKEIITQLFEVRKV